jgi:hypothetical protein
MMLRGSSTSGMSIGVIPSSPDEFACAIIYPVWPTTVVSQLHHRRSLTTAAPRRSARLAKKSLRCTPTVVAAQNVLLKKLGLLVNQEITSDNLDHYIQMFEDGLSEEQAPPPPPRPRRVDWSRLESNGN